MDLSYLTMLPGDKVWVLYGDRVPFVLRPVKTSRVREACLLFSLWGGCYLGAFMDRDPVGNPAFLQQDVILK